MASALQLGKFLELASHLPYSVIVSVRFFPYSLFVGLLRQM